MYPSIPPNLTAGDLESLAPRYEILEEAGRGAMGVVYRARHRMLNRRVAIKVCLPGRPTERFLREGQLLALLRSPHIVAVHDFDQLADGRLLLVMDWVEGSNLEKLLRSSTQPLPETRVLSWMRQVAEGMQTASEQGIIHRDLKPSNILIDVRDCACVADFGLARAVDHELLTLTSDLMGTPYYMAPEQAEDPRRVDSRTDIYSFGATFYHVLTGQPPFQGDTAFSVLFKHKTEPLISPRSHRADLSAPMGEILERCLAKSPSDRFSSFGEILKLLQRSLEGASPWASSEDAELAPYLARYRSRREAYLAERQSWNQDLDVYTFPHGRTLRILRGDIVVQQVDAVVSSDTSHLLMEWGVSQAIRTAAGYTVAVEAGRLAPVRPGRAVVTSGGALPARLVFHGATVGYLKDQIIRPSRDLLTEIMTSCFYHADTHDVRSIAFPLLGTGAMRFPRDICLDTMVQFLARILLRGLTTVGEARIVLYDPYN